MSGERLDQLLVRRGYYRSRSRARDAILRGTVAVEGRPETRPAAATDPEASIAISDPAIGHVSRAALKLAAALDQFGINVTGAEALDIGASTGGFTELLLMRGARHVTAIDVGHGQLAPALAADPRVTAIEGLNARDLAQGHLRAPPDLVTADVSFISLALALPPALRLARPRARLVALIKPQFELGREALGKGGVVRDPALHVKACDGVAAFLLAAGCHLLGTIAAPIAGGDGNREFLIAAETPC